MAALVEDAHRIVAGMGVRARSVRVGTASTALGGLFVNRLISGLGVEVTGVTLPDVDAVTDQLTTAPWTSPSSACAGMRCHRPRTASTGRA